MRDEAKLPEFIHPSSFIHSPKGNPMNNKNNYDLNQINQEIQQIENDRGLTRSVWQHARLVWRMLRSRDIPVLLKFIPFIGVLYIISPLDFIPDAIPALGQLDDIGILLLSLKLFINFSPPQVVDNLLANIRAEDGELVLVEKTPDESFYIIDQKE
jgi:uncharacterized membrane protein YkvA (DUF1232 family)